MANKEAFEAWATNETLGINMALNVSHVTCARKAYLAACAEKDAVIAELQAQWVNYKSDMRPETRNEFLRACSKFFDKAQGE